VLPHGPGSALRRARAIMPTGGGLRDEDWTGRHWMLTWTSVVFAIGLTVTGAFRDRLDSSWLTVMIIVACCLAGALWLPPRRWPSSANALALTVLCTGLVIMLDGVIEAHFSFFVVVGALALYRDWVPFGVTLAGTVAGHLLMGFWHPLEMFNHTGMSGMAMTGSSLANVDPWVWVIVHGVAVLLAAGTQLVNWRLTEVEEDRARQDLTQAEAQFTSAFEEAPVPMIMLDPQGVVLRLNPAYRAWTGMDREPWPGMNVYDLPIQPTEPPRVLERLREGRADLLVEAHTYQYADGRRVYVDLHASALRDDQGRLQLVVCHFVDVTEKRAQQELLYRQSREDALTGLLSRRAFEDDLGALIASRPADVAVIYIDVDRFKTVNDSFGHATGDRVLRTLGGRLADLAPPGSVLARLGGDEFAIGLVATAAQAERLGEALVRSCAEAVSLPGGHLMVTVSVGVSQAAAGDGAESALHSADLAMYSAKQNGRGRSRVFDESMRQDSERRAAAEHLLREALDGDRAQTVPVWFQPIVSLAHPGADPGVPLTAGRRVVGAEALVRLRTADGDLVVPGVFVPLAEETGLVVPLGEHVLRTALARLCEWRDRISYISVNVSPRQLQEADFVPMLIRELEASGLTDRSKLVLEITETSMLQTGIDLRRRLDAIKALGVRLALDDFGTGYSSLTWLQSVPADIVKLDRSFVAGIAVDPGKAAIISAVLWLARALGMSVVAEGVEEEADAAMLAEQQCPNAQGYLFGRPMEAPALATLLPEPGVAAASSVTALPGPRPSGPLPVIRSLESALESAPGPGAVGNVPAGQASGSSRLRSAG
jgi:diguanylate cyclase (GGDEF)-like protein/PAS domain S-box-containing protein